MVFRKIQNKPKKKLDSMVQIEENSTITGKLQCTIITEIPSIFPVGPIVSIYLSISNMFRTGGLNIHFQQGNNCSVTTTGMSVT